MATLCGMTSTGIMEASFGTCTFSRAGMHLGFDEQRKPEQLLPAYGEPNHQALHKKAQLAVFESNF